MKTKISVQARRELTISVQLKYQKADWKTKNCLLNGFIAATGYQRKYAISLLNKSPANEQQTNCIGRKPIYDDAVQRALVTLWQVANQICAKRLVPFLPELVQSLERHGHLSLPVDIRKKLLTVSPATADRLLKVERHKQSKGVSTTKPGALLKKQIQVRTFSDWDDVTPGFLECDLVAHCGEFSDGSFLNTFVLTDIVTGWTEFLPLLCKSASGVVQGINTTFELLPFPLLGIDTDNGSEFINYELLNFCKEKKITFTRSRAYKKNDQAHVEEKNGSIVRRIVGYDRYEGKEAWHALADLYAVLRLYVNYFQPSLKLLSKQRDGSKVTKKYDKAKTPCQRVLNSSCLSEETKKVVKSEYEKLDPVDLLKKLSQCQENFWQHAWGKTVEKNEQECNQTKIISSGSENPANDNVTNSDMVIDLSSSELPNRQYRRTKKPRKEVGPRTWRTREDEFKEVWESLRQQLELSPHKTAKSLLDKLVVSQPERFHSGQLRTLQRRVAVWRREQDNKAKAQHLLASSTVEATNPYLSLVMAAEIG